MWFNDITKNLWNNRFLIKNKTIGTKKLNPSKQFKYNEIRGYQLLLLLLYIPIIKMINKFFLNKANGALLVARIAENVEENTVEDEDEIVEKYIDQDMENLISRWRRCCMSKIKKILKY